MAGWDNVPWFVEGGAEHSPNVARLLAYAAFGGREGIIGPKDLEVRANASSTVTIYPGACSILNRAAGTIYEAYAGRLPSADTVTIAPTGASGGRSDLIVALVKNPWLPGESWPAPSDVRVGPYIDTAVISGVSGTTRDVQAVKPGYSAITLARIDLPANTAVVTQAMITDLRALSQVRNSRELMIASPSATTSLAGSTFVDFPGTANCILTVDVPAWATHCKLRAILGGVKYGNTGTNNNNGWNASGEFRIQFGGASAKSYSEITAWNVSNESGFDRDTFMAGTGSLAIPAGDRDRSTTVRIEARRTAGNCPLVTDQQTTISLEVEWVQKPEANG